MPGMQRDFVNIAGISSNDGASIVFIWGRNADSSEYILLGSGHVVGDTYARPTGISTGQFSVTILLPLGCSTDDVFVTDDKSGKERLSGIVVTPCTGASDLRSPGGIITDDAVERAGSKNISGNPAEL